MNMIPPEIVALLEKYRLRACTPEELDKIELWYAGLSHEVKQPDEEEKAVLKKQMRGEIEEIIFGKNIAKTRSFPFLRIAAAVALVSISAMILYIAGLLGNKPETLFGSSSIVVENLSTVPKEIELSDGSRVRIYSGGKLEYPKKFDTAQRRVNLSGRAFFEIKRNEHAPFLVHTDAGMVTKVLGTSFTIDAEKTKDPAVEVHTGKVMLYKQEVNNVNIDPKNVMDSIVLTANYAAKYSSKNRAWKKMLSSNPKPVFSTEKKPSLHFDESLFGDVLKRVEHDYGISITADNPDILKCSFTGNLSGMNLDDLLSHLTKSINASYTVDSFQIRISGKGCK